jgi:hypothetical protein
MSEMPREVVKIELPGAEPATFTRATSSLVVNLAEKKPNDQA